MASLPGARFDVSGASGSQGLLSPMTSWKCYFLPRGGYASLASTGNLITFDSAQVASRFLVNDWLQVGLDQSAIRQVGAVGGNSISVAGSPVTVNVNDRIFVFGQTQPTVSGGSATYTTPNTIIRQRDDDAASVYANSMVTTNANGLAQPFMVTGLYDVLLQDGNRTNQGAIIDLVIGVPSGISVSDKATFGSSVSMKYGPGGEYYADGFAAGSSTGGVQEALTAIQNAGGGKLVLSAATTYSVPLELSYTMGAGFNNSGKGLVIEGGGWSTVINITGNTNKGLHIIGTSGVTTLTGILKDFKILSNASASSDALVHLQGLAVVTMENLALDGNGKAAKGLLLTATQQGEISGGYIARCTDGLTLAGSGGIRSNAIDTHAVSLANSARNVVVTGADDMMFHNNHLTTAPIGIELSDATSSGVMSVIDNHIESHTTAGISSSQPLLALGNKFYPGTSATDIHVSAGLDSIITSNMIQAQVLIDAAADKTRLVSNWWLVTSSLVDNGTNTTKLDNQGTGPASTFGAVLWDALKCTARGTTASYLAQFLPNPIVAGDWGIRMASAGVTGTVYLQFGTPVIAGPTSNDYLAAKAGISGVTWAKFNANGIHGQALATASLPAAGAAQSGLVVVEQAAGSSRNLVFYDDTFRFRFGGVSF